MSQLTATRSLPDWPGAYGTALGVRVDERRPMSVKLSEVKVGDWYRRGDMVVQLTGLDNGWVVYHIAEKPGEDWLTVDHVFLRDFTPTTYRASIVVSDLLG